jgi:DNA polymerase-3 subunit delta
MLYIIYGSDPLGRREAFEKLRAELDKDGSLATNTLTFDARTAKPQEVISACDTVPFLGDSRLVVVEGVLRSASRFKKAAKRGGKEMPVRPPASEDGSEQDGAEDEDAGRWLVLQEYVPHMPATTTLVLLDEDITAGNPLLKALGPLGKVEHCQQPSERDLPGWVMARSKKIGLKMDAPAAKLLAELVGQDAYMLASELDKLLAYSAGEVVREADVRELVSRAKEHKGYELADAVVAGQGARAARMLQEMLEDGQPTQLILATIAGRYRRIAVARDMLDRGESGSAIAARMGIKMGYGLDRLIEQAERMPVSAVRSAYKRLIEADLDVKRGLMDDDRLALELAVQELASRPLSSARG